jgi:hypothetical protein
MKALKLHFASFSALICLLAMSTSVHANNIDAPTPTEDAQAILAASNIQQTMDVMFSQLVPVMESGFIGQLTQIDGGDKLAQQIEAGYPGGTKAFGKRFGELIMAGFRGKYPDIVEKAAQQYVAEFTPEDLKSIRAFMESPVGLRMTAAQPHIQQQMSATGQIIGRKVGEEAAIQLLDEAGKHLGGGQ